MNPFYSIYYKIKSSLKLGASLENHVWMMPKRIFIYYQITTNLSCFNHKLAHEKVTGSGKLAITEQWRAYSLIDIARKLDCDMIVV